MPKCTINGKEIEVPQGTTVIEAFKMLGDDICHYCWHPGLSVAGVCRLCMVHIEGMPKLQIACNTEVRDGMVVTNQTDDVKDTVKWGLDFHLINHPLDCPICDQAGECGLQDQYMKFGKYDPEMAEPKVKKHKVVDLGPTVVLDSERCILCSRCVRFTEEVTETNELGIFNRGDRAEIGTVQGRPLDNNYSLNTVDICPVGALTSKDFRFRQRVWYLKDSESICPGCSTGCNVKVYFNEEGLWRVKPRYNAEVNGHWMCDEGRNTYKYVNAAHRLKKVKAGQSGDWSQEEVFPETMKLGEKFRAAAEKNPESIAVLVTGQYTNEEFKNFFEFVADELKVKNIFHWINNPEKFDDFDGLLLRGDKNPNTYGLKEEMKSRGGFKSLEDLQGKMSQFEWVLVLGPENQSQFPDLKEKVDLLSQAKSVIWLSACETPELDALRAPTHQIPMKTYIEKEGSFTNFKGLVQEFKRGTTVIEDALTLQEVVALLRGHELDYRNRPQPIGGTKKNHFTNVRGQL
ncbi:MAG: NADH dehydrogenase subunit [Bdellovibrionaceae bacterium]|nr:NADH dehydrogenase subunit [Pseudobdellovibrionaceae bacterium]|tara:strand:+ start:13643 stop:15190 length:1548 start_codon:yes stop_codon:yes gene_type:complete